jgi:hypothetical protein
VSSALRRLERGPRHVQMVGKVPPRDTRVYRPTIEGSM